MSKNTKITLHRCGIEVDIINIQVNDKDENMLDIVYDYDIEKSNIEKGIIEKEVEEVILSALIRGVDDAKEKLEEKEE